jgi:cytochrome oxidase Cu insertion factor (SCO1/SenC/PrrC family)
VWVWRRNDATPIRSKRSHMVEAGYNMSGAVGSSDQTTHDIDYFAESGGAILSPLTTAVSALGTKANLSDLAETPSAVVLPESRGPPAAASTTPSTS